MNLEIDAKSLQGKLAQAEKPLVLDVRNPPETQAEGVIEGALLIPMDQIPSRLAELYRVPADSAGRSQSRRCARRRIPRQAVTARASACRGAL